MASRRNQRTAAQIASALLAQAESDESSASDSSSESEDGVDEAAIFSSDSDEDDFSLSRSAHASTAFISKHGEQWSAQPLHGTVGRPPSFNRPQNLSRPSRDAAGHFLTYKVLRQMPHQRSELPHHFLNLPHQSK